MNPAAVENRIAKALADEEATLWLGAAWSWQAVAEEAIVLARQNWQGIWSESRDPALGRFLEQQWQGRPFGRTLIEVPALIHDVLDREFLFARICPFFYLQGKGPEADKLSQKNRFLARVTALEQLDRIGAGTLLIAGVESPTELVGLIRDDLETARDKLRRIVLTGAGHPDQWRSDLAEELPLSILQKIDLHPDSLVAVLRRIESTRQEYADARQPVLLVGSQKKPLPLQPLLNTHPPIDQYFHLITANDLRPAEREEPAELLKDLLKGQSPPWRAFRHGLFWARPAAEELSQSALKILGEMMDRPSTSVTCIDVEGESGSGLTTALQLLAFRTADQGYPTLLARHTGAEFDYDVLRVFLLGLRRRVSELKLQEPPVVVVLDAAACEHDPRNIVKELPRQLRDESGRVLLVRGTHDKGILRTPKRFLPDFSPPKFLKELNGDELCSLLDTWLRPIYGRVFTERLDENMAEVERWSDTTDGEPRLPLLVCLHLILNEDLRRTVNLGRHLLERLSSEIDAKLGGHRAGVDAAEGVPVRFADGTSAILKFGEQRTTGVLTHKQIAELLAVLAALAHLREPAPRAVLQSMLNLPLMETYRLLRILEDSALGKTELLARTEDDHRWTSQRRLMPASHYEDQESVALLHDLYGPMLLHSLAQASSQFANLRAESDLCADIFRVQDEWASDRFLRVRLLEPVFRRLKYGVKAHRVFAEGLSMQYLRGERPDNPCEGISAHLITQAHEWLPRGMVENSGTLLHSRALARKNLPFEPPARNWTINQCREALQGAADDLANALSLEETRPSGEDPGNLKTSLGLVHRNWATMELNRLQGERKVWEEQSRLAEKILREAWEMKRNSYPASALARLLIVKLKRHAGQAIEYCPENRLGWFPELTAEEAAALLQEVVVLLSDEPQLAYRGEWDLIRADALQLLEDDKFQETIEELKAKSDEMGFVLDALHTLGGLGIPREPTADPNEERRLRRALALLEDAEDAGIEPCGLGNLLRYALLSALPERIRGHKNYDPAYRQRYERLRRLERGPGSTYLSDPIWRYDLAMLCFQVGQTREGVAHFGELRKGRRFTLVPFTRAVDWVRDPDKDEPLVAMLRIETLDRESDRGWGRLVDSKLRYSDQIPFRVSWFTARRAYAPEMFQPGRKIDCKILLRPAGPFAMPPTVRQGTDP